MRGRPSTSRRTGFVLLCRHARHDRGQLTRDKTKVGQPEQYPTEAVGDRLREILVLEDEMVLTSVLHARTSEARSTARVLQDALSGVVYPRGNSGPAVPSQVKARSPVIPPRWVGGRTAATSEAVHWKEQELLDPPRAAVQTLNLDRLERVVARCLNAAADRVHPSSPAVALVGHSPALDLLGARLHRRPRWRRPRAWLRGGVPIQSGEIVCIEVDVDDVAGPGYSWNGRLRWQISPDDTAAEDQIRDKIKSKMETAKQLSAVITLLLTALLGALTRRGGWADLGDSKVAVAGLVSMSGKFAAQAAFLLLLLALGLYLAAMYAYDSLLMPSRFWAAAEAQPKRRWLPRRPPGSAAWILNRNMQRTWAYLFQPATLAVAAAVVVLALPLLQLDRVGQGALVVALIAYVGVVRWFRPVVGSED